MLIWLGMAALCLVCELVTGTFYIAVLGVGCLSAALIEYCNGSLATQVLVAALTTVLCAYSVRLTKQRIAPQLIDTDKNPDINPDIGQSLVVNEWTDGKARVLYRGAHWDVELAADSSEDVGRFFIKAVRGSTLIVSKK